MKEYGADLEKQYNDTKSKLIILEAKIRKRAKLVQKQSPKTHVWYMPLSKFKLEMYKIEDLLTIIQLVEKEYVSKSIQLDAFNSNLNEQ